MGKKGFSSRREGESPSPGPRMPIQKSVQGRRPWQEMIRPFTRPWTQPEKKRRKRQKGSDREPQGDGKTRRQKAEKRRQGSSEIAPEKKGDGGGKQKGDGAPSSHRKVAKEKDPEFN